MRAWLVYDNPLVAAPGCFGACLRRARAVSGVAEADDRPKVPYSAGKPTLRNANPFNSPESGVSTV
jgi:hypothetical protein